MISVRNIHKSFGQLEVLKGIDLYINKGEIVSIVGPSGAGKTTLLQIMGTLYRPDSGSVEISGTDVTRLHGNTLSKFRNQHIGFIFQFHQLLPEFTAIENVMMPALIARASHREAQRQAEELLTFMGLADRADHKPAALSGGEKQRVAAARALINHPHVIFADEPTGNLDQENAAHAFALMKNLIGEQHGAMIIVTHDMNLARQMDRCLYLVSGKLSETPPPTRTDGGKFTYT